MSRTPAPATHQLSCRRLHIFPTTPLFSTACRIWPEEALGCLAEGIGCDQTRKGLQTLPICIDGNIGGCRHPVCMLYDHLAWVRRPCDYKNKRERAHIDGASWAGGSGYGVRHVPSNAVNSRIRQLAPRDLLHAIHHILVARADHLVSPASQPHDPTEQLTASIDFSDPASIVPKSNTCRFASLNFC